jgi:hypothetical protein
MKVIDRNGARNQTIHSTRHQVDSTRIHQMMIQTGQSRRQHVSHGGPMELKASLPAGVRLEAQAYDELCHCGSECDTSSQKEYDAIFSIIT